MLNIKALSKIKHNGTVYEAGSTIFNISKKDAKRLIEMNVAEEVKDDFLDPLFGEDDPDGEDNDLTPAEKAPEENPKQSKKKKSDKKSDEE